MEATIAFGVLQVVVPFVGYTLKDFVPAAWDALLRRSSSAAKSEQLQQLRRDLQQLVNECRCKIRDRPDVNLEVALDVADATLEGTECKSVDVAVEHLKVLFKEILAPQIHRWEQPMKPGEFQAPAEQLYGVQAQLDSLRKGLHSGGYLWLYGPGGVGKSTLADRLRKELGRVDAPAAGIVDVEWGATAESCASQLKQVLQTISGRQLDAGLGAKQVKQAFVEYAANHAVWLLLDNVQTKDQLQALLPPQLKPGGVVIVTSRSAPFFPVEGDWAKVHERMIKHRVAELKTNPALALFQCCAGVHPQLHDDLPTWLPGLADEIVSACGGLPLALRLAGGQLMCVPDHNQWKDVRDALKKGRLPDARSEDKLRQLLSNSLRGMDPACEKMFLDAATALRGRRKDHALIAWQAQHEFAASKLAELRRRQLLSVDQQHGMLGLGHEAGHLRVHDVLAALARNRMSEKAPGSRAWVQDGQVVVAHCGGQEVAVVTAALDIVEHCGVVPKLGGGLALKEHFHGAKVLLAGRHSLGSELPTGLVWLQTNDAAAAAAVVDLHQLRVLDLSWCSELTSLPEGLGQLSALQTLDLARCSGLTSLPDGVGQLTALQTLNLRACRGLTSLPEGVGQLSALQTLDLSRCSELTLLPEGVGQLSTLQTLNLWDCSGLTSLPEGVGQMSALQTLNLWGCSGLTSLPEGVGQLSALQTLDLSRCSGLTSLPEGVGQLSALQTLNLGGCSGLTSLPEGLGQLSALQTLHLWGCSRVTLLPQVLEQLHCRGVRVVV